MRWAGRFGPTASAFERALPVIAVAVRFVRALAMGETARATRRVLYPGFAWSRLALSGKTQRRCENGGAGHAGSREAIVAMQPLCGYAPIMTS